MRMDTLLGHLRRNELQNFKNILPQIKNINSKENAKGNTLLHIAAESGKWSFIKALIAAGGDITLPNNQGDTPLHLAAKQGYYLLVYEFLGISESSKTRALKNNLFAQSQEKARALLKVKNKDGRTPLLLSASLEEDHIYEKMLFLIPGYSEENLGELFEFRQKNLQENHLSSLIEALLESFCPSSSLAEFGESFAYSSLTVTASALVAFSLNIAFAALSLVGLILITFANYKKNIEEKRLEAYLELLHIERAYFANIEKRMAELTFKAELSQDDKNELITMQTALSGAKYVVHKVDKATGSVDFIHSYNKIYTAISVFGGFLCSYSGILGVLGLGLGLAAGIFDLSVPALIASAGPGAIAGALVIGLIIAGFLAYYRYKTFTESVSKSGKIMMAIHDEQKAINSLQKRARISCVEQIEKLISPVEKNNDERQFTLFNAIRKNSFAVNCSISTDKETSLVDALSMKYTI